MTLLLTCLVLVLGLWYRTEGTISVNSGSSPRVEAFYWGAITFSQTLGTAAGDLATEALGLGFQLGVAAFGMLIAAVMMTYYLGANPVLSFWLAYILTRPLGASLGDLLSQSHEYGGLGLGTIQTSIVFLTVIVGLVAWVTFEGDSARRADPAQ